MISVRLASVPSRPRFQARSTAVAAGAQREPSGQHPSASTVTASSCQKPLRAYSA